MFILPGSRYYCCVDMMSQLEVCLIQSFIQLEMWSVLRGAEQQGLSQELETGCLKLAIVKILGVQIFKRDHNILRFQP